MDTKRTNEKELLKAMFQKINTIERKLENVQISLGRVEQRQLEKNDDINEGEFKVFSQWGEDGIIQYLVENLKIQDRRFVEFGVQDYKESNTRYLLVHNNWSGLVIDSDEENVKKIQNDEIYWRYNLKAICSFVTAENINDILFSQNIKGEIGLLSIDIDGNDYWVWKAISCIEPSIVICEYNHRFGKEDAVTIPYDSDFRREKAHYSNIYYGASISALNLLAKQKEYTLVAGNLNGNNLFFVKSSLLNSKVKEMSIEDAYHKGQFRESRGCDGRLSFLEAIEEAAILKKLKLVYVEKNNCV